MVPAGASVGLQVDDGLPGGLAGEAGESFPFEEERILRPTAAAKGAHLPEWRRPAGIFRDAGHLQAASGRTSPTTQPSDVATRISLFSLAIVAITLMIRGS